MTLAAVDNTKSAPRIEYKYLVPTVQTSRLVNALRDHCLLDEHSLTIDGYTVASIYFDNVEFKAYHDKMAGLDERFKFRVRFYPDSMQDVFTAPSCQVEMKYKNGDHISKSKALITPVQLQDLLKGDFGRIDHSNTPIMNHVYRLMKVDRFIPAVRVDYRRLAMFGKQDGNVRITLDTHVKCSRRCRDIIDVPSLPCLPRNLGILEIKTPGYFPIWLTKLVRKYDLTRTAVSKYAAAVQVVAHNSSLFLK